MVSYSRQYKRARAIKAKANPYKSRDSLDFISWAKFVLITYYEGADFPANSWLVGIQEDCGDYRDSFVDWVKTFNNEISLRGMVNTIEEVVGDVEWKGLQVEYDKLIRGEIL